MKAGVDRLPLNDQKRPGLAFYRKVRLSCHSIWLSPEGFRKEES